MIKRLAQCVREYKKDSILSPVFVSLEVLMEVLMPFLTARLIDEGIEPLTFEKYPHTDDYVLGLRARINREIEKYV